MVRLNPVINYDTPFLNINLLLSLRSRLRLTTTFRISSHSGPGLSIAAVYTGSCWIDIRYLRGSALALWISTLNFFISVWLNKTKMKNTELSNVGITNFWRKKSFSYLKWTRSLSLILVSYNGFNSLTFFQRYLFMFIMTPHVEIVVPSLPQIEKSAKL